MLVIGIGSAQDGRQPTQGVDQDLDILTGHRHVVGGVAIQLRDPALDHLLLSEYLAGPRSHELWISACFKCLAIGDQLAVVLGEQSSCRLGFGVAPWRGVLEDRQRLLDLFWCEHLGQPLVEMVDDLVFAEIDGRGVVDLVGDRVLGWVAAAIVRFVVVPVALHPSTARFVEDHALVDVGVLAAGGDSPGCLGAP
ncbi:hypothetical protein ACIGO9_14630 [Nocardia asteroides]|uniref:hypothetical protein n=1 Tax=Nocardia asteroides TaxID=1824 RepID=UPI0037C97420